MAPDLMPANIEASANSQFEEIDWETTDNMVIFPELHTLQETPSHTENDIEDSVNFDLDGWHATSLRSPSATTESLDNNKFEPQRRPPSALYGTDWLNLGLNHGLRQSISPPRPQMADISLSRYPMRSFGVAHVDHKQHQNTPSRPDLGLDLSRYDQIGLRSLEEPYAPSHNTSPERPLLCMTSCLPPAVSADTFVPTESVAGSASMYIDWTDLRANTHSPTESRESTLPKTASNATRRTIGYSQQKRSETPITKNPGLSHAIYRPTPSDQAVMYTTMTRSGDEKGHCYLSASSKPAQIGQHYPEDILELVAAIKALDTGSHGFPYRKHLKDRRNTLVRQHFCSQLGILRQHSPLRQYLGDPVLLDAEYWTYLTEVTRKPRAVHSDG